MTCKNCNKPLQENFCSYCGQSSKVDRINLPNFIEEFTDTIFQINRGLLFTIKELFLRPGHAIREFTEGKRKNYFKPIAYAFLLSTLYFLLSKYIGKDTTISALFSGFSDAMKDTSDGGVSVIKVLDWLTNNHAYTTLLLIPLYALSSHISFFNKECNYLEHVVLNSYIVGQQAIVYMFFLILTSLLKEDYYTELVMVIVVIAYAFWIFRHFFSDLSFTEATLRTLFNYLLNLSFILVLLFILAAFAIIEGKLLN